MYVDLNEIVDKLDDKKGNFIAKCERDIEHAVSSRGKNCLAIKEIGVRTHYPAPDNYIKVLWKFTRNETYHGHCLESVLSEPISELVQKNFSDFLAENRPDIEAQLKQAVLRKLDVGSAIQEIVLDELRKRGVKHVKKEVVDAFVDSCQTAVHSQLGQATSAAVSHSLGTAMSTTVGAAIAKALWVAFGHAISAAVVHATHSVAFKALLKTVIAHSVGAIVTVIVAKMAASKFAAASAGAFLGPLAWAAGGAFVLYKILTIPETLGEKLAEAIGSQMRGDFKEWTEKVLQEYVDNLTNPNELMKSVVKTEIDGHMPDIIGDMVGGQTGTDYDDLEKKAGKLVGYGAKGANSYAKKKGFGGWW